MFKSMLVLAMAILTTSAIASCPMPWRCEDLRLPVPYTTILGSVSFTDAKIRAGYLEHEGTFKGNILYFEGLGDSMLNHDSLFKKISQAGYRVIAFDYMGQGGSTGKMDNTRIEYIPWIGERVWNKFAIQTNDFPNKTIIGWSTGGLAAYALASENKVDKVILIAPGLAPKKIVGEGLKITIPSLTSDVYFNSASNPHREKIVPDSPLKVPSFTIDLLTSAKIFREKPVSSYVKGFVLLSGEKDTYVNAERTKMIIKMKAPHFKIKSYAGALHEIDNERKEIRNLAHKDIISFLNQ